MKTTEAVLAELHDARQVEADLRAQVAQLREFVITGPGGEPLDVRPALAEAVGGWCCAECAHAQYVEQGNWTEALFAACLAAAEVEP